MSDKSKSIDNVKMIVHWFITALDMIKWIALWLLELMCFVGAGVLVVAVVVFLLAGQLQEGMMAGVGTLILIILCVLIGFIQDKPPAKPKKV